MNSDSFAVYRSDYPATHPFQTLGLALTTTNEQVFQITGPQNGVIAAPAQTAILGSQSPFDPNTNSSLSWSPISQGGRAQAGRPFFNSTSFSGRAFRVRAMGTFSQQAGTTNAQTITFRIRQGTNASGNLVCAIASATNTSAAGNWLAEATLEWDAIGQYLNGEQFGFINAQTGSTYITRAQATSASYNVTAYTALQFVATCQVSTTNSTSTATLVEFSMEAI